MRLSDAKSEEAIWAERYDRPIAEGRCMDAMEGMEPHVEFAWDTMYALASCGHLGLAEWAKSNLSRFRQQGPDPDWLLGISHETFRDKTVREKLVAGLNIALAF